MESIPVVDLGVLLNDPSENDWESVSTEVDKVLSTIGFVYLKNHGVAEELVKNAFETSLHFYTLPSEVKEKYEKDKVLDKFGFVSANREMFEPGKYTAELREGFDLNVSKFLNGINPEDDVPESPGFLDALGQLAVACHPLIRNLHRLLARAMKLEEIEFFNNRSKSISDSTIQSESTFRSIYYPPIHESIETGSVRCSPHTDFGTLTLLFQDTIGGLEVRTADGVWVAATPIPGTILVNTGDLLNYWSGGRYPATVHRVLVPEIETKKRIHRQSMPYFINPDNDVIVTPIGPQANVDEHFDAISAFEHVTRRISKLEAKK